MLMTGRLPRRTADTHGLETGCGAALQCSDGLFEGMCCLSRLTLTDDAGHYGKFEICRWLAGSRAHAALGDDHAQRGRVHSVRLEGGVGAGRPSVCLLPST